MLGVIAFPALFIWGFEVAVGLVSETVRRFLHLAAIFGLFSLLAIQVAKKLTDLRGPVLVAIALGRAVLVLGGVWMFLLRARRRSARGSCR